MSEIKPEVRIYQPGKDEEKAAALFNATFEEKISPAFWRHKYGCNPNGGWAFFTFVGEELVSIAGWPVRWLKVEENKYRTASMSDVMVHPSWRGRFGGRLGSMARPLWEEIFNREDVHLGLGFPNPKHYLVGKRFVRAKDLGEFEIGLAIFSRFWRVPLLAETLRRLRGIAQKSPLGYEEIPLKEAKNQEFLAQLDALWEEVQQGFPVAYIKDAAYLNWRYFVWEDLSLEKRRSFYLLYRGKALRGFLVLRRSFIGSVKGFELEEILCPKEEVPSALETAKALALRQGGHFLRYLLSPADGLRAEKIEKKAPVLWRPFSYKGDLKEIERRLAPPRWHLTLGDIAV